MAGVVPSCFCWYFSERFLLCPATGGLETYAAPDQLLGRSSHVRQAHVSPSAGWSRILLGLLPEGAAFCDVAVPKPKGAPLLLSKIENPLKNSIQLYYRLLYTYIMICIYIYTNKTKNRYMCVSHSFSFSVCMFHLPPSSLQMYTPLS